MFSVNPDDLADVNNLFTTPVESVNDDDFHSF